MKKIEKPTTEKERNSTFLKNRARINQKKGKYDLEKFIFDNLGDFYPRSILDLGCGRGKQISVFKKRFPDAKIVGVDVSRESIDFLKSCFVDKKNADFYQKSIYEFLSSNKDKFDLIISTYALYYERNFKKIFSLIKKSLSDKGVFCVVGPYGQNNKEIFSIVGKENISDYILFTSRDFMFEVAGFMNKNFENVKVSTLANPISYSSEEEFMDYWRSTTFYNESLEKKISKKIKKVFSERSEFINYKHVMFCSGSGKRQQK